MINAVALETLQLSSEEPPSEIVDGLAVNEVIVGSPPNGQLIHDASKSGNGNMRAMSK